ncbi:MAG: MFS transporter [Alphaproteobacteria bacterium]|nr:MFS transporter [Alphaproteobacteria bacterium]MBU1515416.1 MFS transporter [Alphaproteobacteria bacterium]MBU2092949.1 MFS transporter [Alphaproteobacteria bacterium]MBU2154224.1 MFS transporter [Alphaproteobacteria bacterium]MBU2306074.1 MFS transporter [Alphaproteobacteria bacterium]
MDTPSPAISSGRAWYAVLLLGTLYIVAFVDRAILGLLVEPIKADLGVTDNQMSLLIGATFAVFYSLVGLPLGRLADRISRRQIIIATALVWGSCTFASGFATTFLFLCLMRIGVAVGEAALTPSVTSLISDMFPRERRARAMGIYVAMGNMGAKLAYVIGGLVLAAIGTRLVLDLPVLGAVKPWQAVFMTVAAPALLIALLIFFTLPEPARPMAAQAAPVGKKPIAALQSRWRPLVLLFVGGALGQTIVLGMSAWAPSYLLREFGWQISEAGIYIGAAATAGGVSGVLIFSNLVEWLVRRGHLNALPMTLVCGLLSGSALMVAAGLAATPMLFLVLFALGLFALSGTGVMCMVAVQWTAPTTLRGELMSTYLLINSLLSMGLGPSAITLISGLFGGPAHLAAGFIAVAAVCGPLGAAVVLSTRAKLVALHREAIADGA